ncbi:BTAD domain-containing putative transcriptional regulator [Nonomuraea sp. NPDC050786]|uniref:AfsR/SARP family transcriptional regulator n=1 Tax=Nonomuraea sp. NPDC050786 TaxID=3154840 RepID=UPI0033D3B2CA
MPTQTVELPKFPLTGDAAPSVTTDAPHERASGRQAEALAAYAGLRATLISEQGLEPGRAVRELHRRILAADPALDTAVRHERGTPQPQF